MLPLRQCPQQHLLNGNRAGGAGGVYALGLYHAVPHNSLPTGKKLWKLDPSVQLMLVSLVRLLPNLAPLDDFGAWFSANCSKVHGPVHASTSQ